MAQRKTHARSLESLQRRYNLSAANGKGGMGGFGGPGGPGRGGPGRGGRGAHGKPKNTGKTVARLLGYVGKSKYKLVLVFVFMLVNTLASLIASYMLSPIINHAAAEYNLIHGINNEFSISPMSRIADDAITALTQTPLIRHIMDSFSMGAAVVYLVTALLILAVVYLIGILTTYLQARLMLSVSQDAIEKLRNDLFCKMQKLPVRYFDSNTTGEIMSRYTNDVDNIDVMLNNSLTQMVSGTITLIGTFVFMLTTNWILTLITVVFIPIFAFGGSLIGKKSSKYYKEQQSALGAVNGYIEETVTGQKVVKVFNHEDTCVEEFEELNNDMRDKQFRAMYYGGIMGPIMGNTSQISYAVTVGVGGILMITRGFTPGDLTVFAGYARQFSMPINNISQQMTTIFAALAGAERVFDVMDSAPEAADAKDAVGEYPPVPGGHIMQGDVALDHVIFGYIPEKTVLKDISLYAHPGQKIAFVGSTGAGKTTITNLLNRFYDINQGTITIDGIDVKQYNRSYLRQNIAMVLQDTHLFTGTIMENIRYGRLDATDDEVITAAKTASAHSFIMRLADGYQTMLEGDGANLSQGQRQLLNIARAALSKAPILVLDEATSSVDTRTERHIEHGMDRLMKNRTTFVIAHRLSTVRNADAIMVLEHGEIIERGNHDDLLALKGRYYELYTGRKELD